MKRLFVILGIICCIPCIAQDANYRRSISGEIFGLSAIGISTQYGYLFKHSVHGFYDVRIGIGGWYYKDDAGISIPHAFTYNFKSKRHFIEVGIGSTFIKEYYLSTHTSALKYFTGPMIGYKSISPKGLQFRIYANCFFNANETQPIPFAGIGFGKVFRKKQINTAP